MRLPKLIRTKRNKLNNNNSNRKKKRKVKISNQQKKTLKTMTKNRIEIRNKMHSKAIIMNS